MVTVCVRRSKKVAEDVTVPVRKVVEVLDRICRDLPWPLDALCGLVKKLVEVVEWVVQTVVRVIYWMACTSIDIAVLLWNIAGKLVLALLKLPVLGPVLRWWFGLLSFALSQFIGFWEGVLGLLGVLPVKNLRLVVIVLRSPAGSVISEAQARLNAEEAARIFYARANVRVDWRLVMMASDAPREALYPEPGVGFFLDDLSSTASRYYHRILMDAFPEHAASQALRFAAPVFGFVVEDVVEKAGTSGAMLTDYFLIGKNAALSPRDATIAHELGHSCGLLLHSSDKTNLMSTPPPRGTNLSPAQRAIVRSSPHVTYL